MEEREMMNPAAMMKMMGAFNTFKSNHPKFTAFLSTVFMGGMPEGTIIEITVTKPDQAPITSNMRVMQSDLELVNSLKDLGNN